MIDLNDICSLFSNKIIINMKSSTIFSSFFLFLVSSTFVSWSLLLLSDRVVVVVDASLNSEGEALVSLKNKFFYFDEYSTKLNWNLSGSNSTPCQWSGVSCNVENTHMVSLTLGGNGIYGQLGSQIGQLKYLKSVDLSYNHFDGSIPPQIGQLRYLEKIRLSSNNFSGSIPIELWNCSRLQHLDLSLNNFTGELSETVRNLHQLTSFDVFSNHLSGRIPESLFQISQISGLEYVDLRFNNFSGSIPFNIGNATNMKGLRLTRNQLHGYIPTSITNCTKLDTLFLDENDLSGEIPLGVWRIPTLVSISVNDNNLSGELPVEMTGIHHLENLFLNNNHFSGMIPEALGINGTNLNYVDFSNNNFSGEIPPNHCFGNRLTILDLSGNQLSGKLPNCLGDSNQLSRLNLRNNNFSGTISLNFTSDQLLIFDLNGNHFEGKIPRSLAHSKGLTYLDLGNNQLNDTFPFFLEVLLYLEILVLRSNKLHGPLTRPRTHLAFNQLKFLDISSNYFIGDLPLEFGFGLQAMKHIPPVDEDQDIVDPNDLFYADISIVVIHKGNEMRLNSTLMSTFRAIDMSNNRFQGRLIEGSIGELLLLKMLNLSNNNLNGHIPSSIGNLTQLESLDLSQNKLFGEIPLQLTNLHFLAALNLSHNNLTGRIPSAGQFQTFSNDSFDGNPGLCGNQLSTRCVDDIDKESGQNPTKEMETSQDSKFWNFGWEPVVIGYGCGMVIGLVIQYFLFTKAFLYRWFG